MAWRQLESFNADVAHELRTRLTNLIGQTQLGLSRRRSQEELEELLGSNLEELERMASIVNDMLFLSHAHAGEHASQLAQVSLREETFKTAEYVELSFAEKQLVLRVEGDALATSIVGCFTVRWRTCWKTAHATPLRRAPSPSA